MGSGTIVQDTGGSDYLVSPPIILHFDILPAPSSKFILTTNSALKPSTISDMRPSPEWKSWPLTEARPCQEWQGERSPHLSKKVDGVHALWLRFEGEGEDLFIIDWLRFDGGQGTPGSRSIGYLITGISMSTSVSAASGRTIFALTMEIGTCRSFLWTTSRTSPAGRPLTTKRPSSATFTPG